MRRNFIVVLSPLILMSTSGTLAFSQQKQTPVPPKPAPRHQDGRPNLGPPTGETDQRAIRLTRCCIENVAHEVVCNCDLDCESRSGGPDSTTRQASFQGKPDLGIAPRINQIATVNAIKEEPATCLFHTEIESGYRDLGRLRRIRRVNSDDSRL
jgi:hypothetical protein